MVELEIREGLTVSIIPMEVEGGRAGYEETDADDVLRAKLGPALEVIGGLADTLGDQIVRLGEKARPDEITLTFTVGFTSTAGLVLASGSASGTVAVSMKWVTTKSTAA